jgi:superfamily I DNA/RNA helicase
MSTALQHTLIRASAGTGKTYQLANRYLALLLLQLMAQGRAAPSKIVALTFTRKGAGEFTQRILQRLAAAAADAGQRAKLQADLMQLVKGDPAKGLAGLAPGVEVEAGQQALESALEAMINEFDRLMLGTIDSFMSRSVQTMAFELGLGGFAILDEPALERQREEILGAVFNEVQGPDLAAFGQALKLATLKSSSSLRGELAVFVQSYQKLLRALPQAEAWGGKGFWNGTAPRPHPDWRQAASALAEQIAAHNFGHAGLGKALAGALEWVAQRIPGTTPGTMPAWLKADGKLVLLWNNWPKAEWTFDFQSRPRTVPAAILTPLRGILAGWIAAECEALSQKTAAIGGVVSKYENLYDQMARRKGRLTFDDLPLLLDENLAGSEARSALLLLGLRWYQKFDHWLLDEFQDTSRVQWGVLKPWLDEALQDGDGAKSVFIVGDAKQSIYGWRGGEPRLSGELLQNYPGLFQEQIMAESWRSRPAVLELVNRVCTPASNPALRDAALFPPAALQRWDYDPHVAAPDRAKHSGYAAVLLTATEEEEDESAECEVVEDSNGDEAADKLAPQGRVIKSVLESVRPLERGLTCGILVRKNQNAQALAGWLRNNGVPQVMVEGVATLAEQSPVVAAFVDALRWLAAPANTLAGGLTRITPLWDVLIQPLSDGGGADVRPGSVWRHWNEDIARSGAAEVTSQWCAALAPGQNDSYLEYCLHHVSQLARQSGTGLTLAEWLAALQKLTVRETAATGAIHVMTIHKSKGLGFDVVFLPDLDSAIGGEGEVLIRRDERGIAVGCLAQPPKWLQAWEPALGRVAASQQADQALEALCLLYVALTRSKEATFVVLNGQAPRRAAPARDLILGACIKKTDAAAPADSSYSWGNSTLQWEAGSPSFAASLPIIVPSSSPAPAKEQLSVAQPRRKRRKPSDAGHELFCNPSNPIGSGGGRKFGTAVHQAFEQICWWTPGQILRGDPEVLSLVDQCLQTPEIRVLFTAESGFDEALREVPIEFLEKDIWWSGVIDRLVLRCDASGNLLKAVLVDYKTDRVESTAILRERYEGQLSVYRRAVATALNLPHEQVEVLLLSTHLGRVESLRFPAPIISDVR